MSQKTTGDSFQRVNESFDDYDSEDDGFPKTTSTSQPEPVANSPLKRSILKVYDEDGNTKKLGQMKQTDIHAKRGTIKTISFNPNDIRDYNLKKSKSINVEDRNMLENESFDPSFYDTCKTKRHEDYLHAVTQTIPIGELFSTVGVKNDNEENQYCTVLLQVNQQKLRQELKANYLLQVWDKRGKKVYQKPLQRYVESWNNFDDFVLFKYEDEFEETNREETIYLIKLDPNGRSKVVKIHINSDNQLQNFPILGYFQNFLLIGNSYNIRYIDIKHIMTHDQMLSEQPEFMQFELDFNNFKELEFKNGSRLLDMLDTTYGYMCIELETDSAELEYLEFRSLSMEDGAEFFDLSDNANRELEGDPIEYYESIRFYSNEDAEYKQCALAYRQSGEMDFYWNYRLVESATIEEMGGCKCIGVYSDFDRLYYRLLPKDLDPETNMDQSMVYSILTIWKEEIGLTSSQPAAKIKKKRQYIPSLEHQRVIKELVDPYYEHVVHSRLSRYARIYTSFMTYETSVIVAHNKFLSIYNIFTKTWEHHTFEDQIVEVFRNLKPKVDTVFNVAVLIGGHTLRFLEKKDLKLTYDPTQTPIDIGGQVLEFAVDQVYDTAFYMVVDRNVKKQQMLNEVQGSGSYVPYTNSGDSQERAELVAFLDEGFTVLSNDAPKDSEVKVQVSSNPFDTVIVMDSFETRQQVKFPLNFCKDKVILGKVETHQWVEDSTTPAINSQAVNEAGIDLSQNFEYKFVGCIKPGDKYGDKANDIIEMNDGHIFITNYEKRTQKCFKDRKIRDFVIDNAWMYTIQDNTSAWQNNADSKGGVRLIKPKYKGEDTGGHQLPAGLYVYDLNRLVNDGNIENYLLELSTGGVNNHIDLSFETQTITFIKNYNEIKMIPIPHRNTINFIGIGPKDDYLIWRHSGGTFTALSKNGKLNIWSVATGKHLDIPNMGIGQSLLEYEVYQNGPDDISYLADWQRFDTPAFVDPLKREHDFSISLICREADEMEHMNDMRTSVNIQAANYAQIFGPDADVKVTQARYNYRLYKFAVLTLKNATVEIAYSFTKYRLLPDKTGRQPIQKLTFSQDLERMLEVLDDSYAIIYKKNWKDKKEKLVSWRPLYYINRFPSLLAGQTSANFIFSPNFELYWDTDFLSGEFIIRRAKDQSIFARIEGGLMSLSFKGQDKTKKSIQALGSRLSFISETHIRVITKDGLDVILKIPEMEIVLFSSVPNFDVNDFTHRHAIIDQNPIDSELTFERLVRKSSNIQILQNHIHSRLPDKTLSKEQQNLSDMKLQNALNETIFTVDYTQNTGNLKKDKFQIEMSFTILDWIIIDKIIDVKTFELVNIDKKKQLQLCFNILPRLINVFHKFADDATRQKDIERLYTIAKEGFEDENGDLKTFYLPYIYDQAELSPIDYSLREEGGKLNVNTAAVLLKQVEDYPLLHLGSGLTDTMIQSIKHQVPVIGEFSDARLKKAEHLSSASMKKKSIMPDRKKIIKGHYYGDSEQDIWCNKLDLDREPEMLFNPKGYKKLMDIMYYDMIEVNTFSERGQKFFKVLEEYPGADLFAHRSLQMVITYRWNKMRWYIFLMQFFPYMVMLGLYSYWANFLQVEEVAIQTYGSKQAVEKVSTTFNIILMFFNIYFIYLEVQIMQLRGWNYWMLPWKYVDILPLTLIFFLQITSLISYDYNQYTLFVRTRALASLIMWLKFLYYLRIWKTTGYLVRMLTEVINEMKIFLLVLGIIVIAFSDAFYTLAVDQECLDDVCSQKFLETYNEAIVYSYLLILGEFGDYKNVFRGENETVLTILLVVCTLLNLVVMLNLLISIISGTYARVSVTQEEYSYKAKLSVITEVQIMPYFQRDGFNMMNKFLLYAVEHLPIIKNEDDDINLEMVLKEIQDLREEIKRSDAEKEAAATEDAKPITHEQRQMNDVLELAL